MDSGEHWNQKLKVSEAWLPLRSIPLDMDAHTKLDRQQKGENMQALILTQVSLMTISFFNLINFLYKGKHGDDDASHDSSQSWPLTGMTLIHPNPINLSETHPFMEYLPVWPHRLHRHKL